MPGRKGFRGGGRGDKEKDNNNRESSGSGGGARSVFATFWANASYKSFAKPHFRETGGSRSDLEEEDIAEVPRGAGAGVAAGGALSPPRPSIHHHHHHHHHGPYDSDASIPSLSQDHSHSDESSRDDERHHHHHHRQQDVDVERGMESILSPVPRSLRIPDKRTPSGKFTTHQLLYVFGSHGVGAFAISGGINFAIAYAMYTRTDDPIRLFELPNTLIGDFAVTTIMQTIITWMIEMIVVNRDLRKASVRPIGFVDEPQLQDPSSPSSPLSSISRRLPRCAIRGIRWFMLLDQPKTQRKRRGSFTRKLRYVFAQILRALLVGVFLGALLIGPTVGILIALGVKEGGDWVYASRWTPEIFKLILGGVLALLTSPFFAMYWMIKCGWNGGIHESVMINGNETK